MEEAAITKELYHKFNEFIQKNCHQELADNNVIIDDVIGPEPLHFGGLSNDNIVVISQTFVCFKNFSAFLLFF